MTSREVMQRLRDDGWFEVAQKGSHKQFKHPTKPGRVTVPHPVRDIPIGTLAALKSKPASNCGSAEMKVGCEPPNEASKR